MMASRKFSPEEKKQLLANLDFEVEHRIRQLEEWLQDALQNFKLHQEGLISRIPRPVRAVSMAEFADKYDGDVQACLRGLQGARLGLTGDALSIDKDTRKRKWVSAQEDVDTLGNNVDAEAGPSKAAKSARLAPATPKKKVGLSTIHESGQKSRVFQKTPGAARTFGRIPPSPSPQKLNRRTPSTTATSSAFPRIASPSKPTHPTRPPSRTQNTQQPSQTSRRPPSTLTFAPSIPKAPIYPTLRAPRRDESMLSVNGSPLANPYTLGLGWFAGGAEDPGDTEMDGDAANEADNEPPSPSDDAPRRTMKSRTGHIKRAANGIVVRRDNSATSLDSLLASSRTSNSSSEGLPHAHGANADAKDIPRPPSAAAFLQSARAIVAIPTKDGHILEFDPLSTSPRALDALAGITDSAKKQAKEEMARLVQAALSKWTLS